MIRSPVLRLLPLALPVAAAALLAGCASLTGKGDQRAAVDNLALGTDSTGDACTLQFRWNDPGAREGIARSYSINCARSAGRAVGTIRVTLDQPEDEAACGEARMIDIAGLGPVEVRRCGAPELGGAGVRISFRRGNLHYRGVAQTTVVGPLQTGLVAVARQPSGGLKPVPLAFQVADLPPLAGNASVAAATTVITNPGGLLRSGIRRNQLGLYLDASRDLNDAIGRLPADTPPALRAELELEAALADSNISAVGTADAHFRAARDLLKAPGSRTSDRYLVLINKLRVYEALDQLNRRDADEAITRLKRADPLELAGNDTVAPRGILYDNRVQRDLNAPQVRSGEAARALSNDAGERELRTIDIQADRTESIALLGKNRVAEAKVAIDRAKAKQATLVTENNRGNLAWLTASIDRQSARVASRSATPEGWASARDSAQAAVDALEQASRASGYSLGQAVAEARIDHARYMGEAGADTKLVMAEYERAIADLEASSAPGVTNLPGIERYLDLLVADAKAGSTEAPARFFRAVQVLGKPAIARQTADMQSIVNEDPTVAAQVRQRLQGLNEIRRLSNLIADAEGGGELPAGTTLADLQDQRRMAEISNDAVTALLQESNKFRAVDDSPVPLADLRDKVLRPGEVYFKLTALPLGATYGIAIGHDRSVIYKSALPTRQLTELARRIRVSIDNDAPYEVGAAYGLFTLVAGDAAEMLTAAGTERIVVDPAGPLETVPLAVLVTDRESSLWYAQHRKVDPADFSQVKFLAAQAEISTALGPRSFMITRSFKPITSGRAFLGLGRHERPSAVAADAEVAVMEKRQVCADGRAVYRQIWNLAPISDRELGEAARALGDPQARSLTGAAFTDTAVLADPEVSQARVIHFATHGLPEERMGCVDIPPSLVTSLGTEGSDGLLSFDEIARLRLNANLVVLSACDTAGTLSERAARQAGLDGGALAGLVRSFLAAEARAVIATYWKIPATEQSEQLLAAFYTSGRTHDIGTALRDAQLSLIRTPKYSHPYNWGAFFLVGDGSKTMLGNQAVAADSTSDARIAMR